jgi:hypothetical protein
MLPVVPDGTGSDTSFHSALYRHGMRRDPAAKQRLRALVERGESK